jgi:hypothetical protein
MAELLAWFGSAAAEPSPAVDSKAIDVDVSEATVEDKAVRTSSTVDAPPPASEPEPIIQESGVTKAAEASQPRPGLRAPISLDVGAVQTRPTPSDAGSDSPKSTMRLLEPKTKMVALFRGPVMPYYYIGKDGLQHTGQDIDGCGLELSGRKVVTIHREGMAARWAEFKKGDSACSCPSKPNSFAFCLCDADLHHLPPYGILTISLVHSQRSLASVGSPLRYAT